jgi:NAD(P)-dependent dehydrogenase (short-subunit alcohol dehydrogenase family)
MMNINLHGLFYCCREFGKVMLRQGLGSIVNVASISGLISNVPQPQAASRDLNLRLYAVWGHLQCEIECTHAILKIKSPADQRLQVDLS